MVGWGRLSPNITAMSSTGETARGASLATSGAVDAPAGWSDESELIARWITWGDASSETAGAAGSGVSLGVAVTRKLSRSFAGGISLVMPGVAGIKGTGTWFCAAAANANKSKGDCVKQIGLGIAEAILKGRLF